MEELNVKGAQGSGGPFKVKLTKSEAQQILNANYGDQIKLSTKERTLSIYEDSILCNTPRNIGTQYDHIDAKLGAGSSTFELDSLDFIKEIKAKFGL